MKSLKESGVEWIGKIPVDWKLNKIGSLYHERNIKVSDKEYQPLSVTKQGVVPQLETVAKTENGDNRKQVLAKDFVINSRSDRRGSCGISPLDGSVSLINTVLKPRENMNNLFYQYVFRSEQFADEFFRWGNGIVDDLWSTKWSNMKRIYIPQPNLDEQNIIGNFLDQKCAAIDRILDQQQAIIEKFKAYKQSIVTKSVVQGLKQYPLKSTKMFWIGEIPVHWQVGQLKRFATIRSGITLGKKYPPGSVLVEYPYLRVANVQGDYVDLSDVATVYVTKEEARKYMLKPGEVLMTEGGDRDKLGRGCIWNGEIEQCLHQNHVFAVKTDEVKLNSRYFDYITTSNVGRNYFNFTAKKTTNLASTNSTTILEFRLPIPPLQEQLEIADYLEIFSLRIDNIIEKKQALMNKLKAYKKSLIYEAVTGKLEIAAPRVVQFPAFVNSRNKRFAQAVLMSKIIDNMGAAAVGRVKLEKILYTIETHVGFNFETQYKRQVAGPFDESIYECEGIISKKNKWFRVQGKKVIHYYPAQEKNNYKPYYVKYFNDYNKEISSIIEIFKPFNMDEAEKIATLYAAWNDAIIKDNGFTDDSIVDDVLNNWNDSKKRFTREEWLRVMHLMRDIDLVPKGYGKLTQRV